MIDDKFDNNEKFPTDEELEEKYGSLIRAYEKIGILSLKEFEQWENNLYSSQEKPFDEEKYLTRALKNIEGMKKHLDFLDNYDSKK